MKSLRAFAVVAIVALTIGSSFSAQAALVVDATVGGAPTGVSYVNFDNLPLGSAGGTSGGVTVTFTPDGQVVTGSSTNYYAAPYISNSNGASFSDNQASGPDTTPYVTTGIGTATLTMPGAEEYLGLLWGSVDAYNTLSFYNGTTLIGSLTGTDITASANGDQGVNGTYYVNIVSSTPFTSVVASSSQYAFEFDNLSYNPTNPVPEPLSLALLGLGIAGLWFGRRRGGSALAI